MIYHKRRSSRKVLVNGILMAPKAIRNNVIQIGSIHWTINRNLPFPTTEEEKNGIKIISIKLEMRLELVKGEGTGRSDFGLALAATHSPVSLIFFSTLPSMACPRNKFITVFQMSEPLFIKINHVFKSKSTPK